MANGVNVCFCRRLTGCARSQLLALPGLGAAYDLRSQSAAKRTCNCSPNSICGYTAWMAVVLNPVDTPGMTCRARTSH
jgi:hypothetical protein